MATSEKIQMFSLTELEYDLASFAPIFNEIEEAHSKENSSLNPVTPANEYPKPSPNKEAHVKKLSDEPSPSHEENNNPCAKGSSEPVGEPLQNLVTCSENQSTSAKKQLSFSCTEGAEKETGKEKAIAEASVAAVRKLPDLASNQCAEKENGRCGESGTQTGKESDLALESNLQGIIEALSGNFDEENYAEMDILEIAEMKGIVFENPSWWPPESFRDRLPMGPPKAPGAEAGAGSQCIGEM